MNALFHWGTSTWRSSDVRLSPLVAGVKPGEQTGEQWSRIRAIRDSDLYLEVSPAGSKRWFWKTYANGKEGRMALGSYPAMSLAEARKARDTSC
ncbi:Arm DNA-binding domain-containing protein [Variovorax atrisoli]|uniref:Arm DNA-binding domain-containing protein n=1 Tax=Variovorax atrisoli TaxID=3394203 RepID=UPI003906375A